MNTSELNEDDILDALPMHLRNKVLESIEIGDDGEVKRAVYKAKPKKPKSEPLENEWHKQVEERRTRQKRVWPLLLLWPFLFLFAAPFVIVGLAICITIIGIPFGVGIMMLGCSPTAWCTGRILQRLATENGTE